MLANAWKGKGPVQDGIAGYGKLGLKRASVAEFRKRAGMLMLAGLMVSIVLTNVKGAQTAGEIMLSSLTAASQTFTALMNYHGIFLELSSLPGFNKSAFSGALRIGHSFTSSAGKAGAAGAVIGGVATWALFFAAWGKGGLAANSVEFNNLLAGAIASTLVIVLTFFLSLSVVGAIILAVFGIFDLITLIICKAGAKKACSLGITEAITKLITEWIYTGSVMIDTKADPAITNIDDAQLHLT